MGMLYDNAKKLDERAALVHGDSRISHAELADRAERLAHGLAVLGVRPGDPVALVLPNAPSFAISFFAVAGLGAVAVPLNTQFKEDELAFCFRHSRIRALITDERNLERCRRLAARSEEAIALITTSEADSGATSWKELMKEHPPSSLGRRPSDEDVVFQFSSGSTGRPKRLTRTQEQCWWEAENFVSTAALTPEDTIFCAIPLFHTHGMGNCLLAAARSGATLVILEDPSPFVLRRQRALELLERERATVFPGVPFIFRHLAEAPGDADLSALRLCFSAGTALPGSTFEAFHHKFGVPIRQLYGCTEAGSLTINLEADPRPTADSVGTPIGTVEFRVVDEAGAEVAPGQVGEIAIRSPAMTNGYAEMEQLNRTVFRNGYFFTGDLGRVDAAGRLYLTGRKRFFIEVAGNKVDGLEVEDVLAAHPKVREAAVVGIPGPVEGEHVIKAFVVLEEPCDERELIEACQRSLANFKVPQSVEFRSDLPKSPLGKLLRKDLI